MTLEQAEQKYKEYINLMLRLSVEPITTDCLTNYLTKEAMIEYQKAKSIIENAKKKAELEQMLKMLEEGEIK